MISIIGFYRRNHQLSKQINNIIRIHYKTYEIFIKLQLKRVFLIDKKIQNQRKRNKINNNTLNFATKKTVSNHFIINKLNQNHKQCQNRFVPQMSLRPYLNSNKSRQKQIQSSYQKRSTMTSLKEYINVKQKQRTSQLIKPTKEQSTFECSSSTKINLLNKDFLLGKQFGPLVTSTHFQLYDEFNNTYVGQRETQQRQVASLTKIMTSLLALELMQKYQLQKNLMVRVSRSCVSLNGTSARLVEGCFIKLYDLLYGTMLPSGNDAAYLLAQVFGLLLFYQNIKPQQKQYVDIQSIDLSFYDNTVTFVNRYIKQMNKKAKQLKMNKTTFVNPHGLANVLNLSTAHDMLILSQYAADNKSLREIMSTKQYQSQLFNQNMRNVSTVRKWKNTNKLIDDGWQGVKTGHTNSAGCCLASLKNGIFIVVLNSSTTQARFDDTMQIYRWYQTTGIASVNNVKKKEKEKSQKQLQPSNSFKQFRGQE